MPFDIPSIPRAAAPRIEQVGLVPADLDLHALALILGCPALIERGDAPRERWHVLPLWPRGVLQSQSGRVVIAWPGICEISRQARGLDALRALVASISTARPEADIPFAGGLVLMLGYDVVHEIERLPATTERRDDLPDMVAYACPAALLVPVGGGHAVFAWLQAPHGGEATWGLSAEESRLGLADLRRAIREVQDDPFPPREGRPIGPVRALWTRDDHEAAVREIIVNLRAGEIYQANLSQRFEVPWEGSALGLHRLLRRTNPSPFSGWMRALGDDAWELISGSPERLVALKGRELVTEPIAGTIPLPKGRATSMQEIAELAASLSASPKDRAEHVMIVDLHRNDLGRVSAPGTVRVEEMMRLDRRSHVVQAIADIRGVLDEGKDAVDVIEAIFPGGCVTGVPRIRAMEILDGLERWNRGPYTGSFGFIASWGDMDLNVLIRSAWRIGDRLAFSAGGGIVLASDPAREYDESLAKAAAMRAAIEALA